MGDEHVANPEERFCELCYGAEVDVRADDEIGAPARATGISAGSDRQPPDRLVNRLYVTDPANNRLLYLSFD